MSEYHLQIQGSIGLSDYSNIHDYIGLIDVNDKVTIVLNENDIVNGELICKMLQDNNFVVTSNGTKINGGYTIEAFKNK